MESATFGFPLPDRNGKIRANIEASQATNALIRIHGNRRFVTAGIEILGLLEDIEAAHLPAVTAVLADQIVDEHIEVAEVTAQTARCLRCRRFSQIGPFHGIEGR